MGSNRTVSLFLPKFDLHWNWSRHECLKERHHNFWTKFSIYDHSDTDYREIINSYCPPTLCALLSGKSVRTPQLLQWKTFFGVTAYITKNCSIERTQPPRFCESSCHNCRSGSLYRDSWDIPKNWVFGQTFFEGKFIPYPNQIWNHSTLPELRLGGVERSGKCIQKRTF